ncbi:dTMP kinase [Anabaena sp. FACHB-1237]|uniref:dTMP kinase n=1 Tax=Anabaena sp. FACHB-1237 TaxID=2692769 RepID=UPI00168177AC|nr:dTMP kinase [Anabaena sp. FACHB-1237]MBD2138202.1 dTMP kinase [Anabaena sp. FACHB-1237]
MSGKLIVFEGVEGCGKSTQIQCCYQWLTDLGRSAIITREPGGTELGQHLRHLLLQKSENYVISELTELLLYAADRAQHIAQMLKPELLAGKYILCDRYIHSTIAYQGYGRGLNMAIINGLNDMAIQGLKSDLTIWLDVDVTIGLARKKGGEMVLDRIEQETIAFHRRVQQGYTELATLFPDEIVRIDGNLDKHIIESMIKKIVSDRFFS